MTKYKYIIIDKITSEVLCHNDEWDSFILNDNNYYGVYKLFGCKKDAIIKKQQLEHQFIKIEEKIDFKIVKVAIKTQKYLKVYL